MIEEYKCNKVAFLTKKHADARLRDITNTYKYWRHNRKYKRGNWNTPTRSYECGYCGMWHLTSEEYNPNTIETNLKLEDKFKKYLDDSDDRTQGD